MSDQTIAKVYRTTDHSKFKHLEGNRDVTDIRARRIKNSIEKNGYIFNPIIVNEHMEIIDGGGRQQVLEQMGLAVDYIIRPGLSVKDCQALNSAASTWKQIDYINSYADMGNVNYIYLRNLITRFPDITVFSIIAAVMDNVTGNNKMLIDGELICTENQYNYAGILLSYANRFMNIIKRCRTKTRSQLIIGALMFARKLDKVDHERLYKQFEKLYPSDMIADMQDIDAVLRGLSTMYNYQYRGQRIYFETEYKQYQSEKVNFYRTRYGDGKDKKEAM